MGLPLTPGANRPLSVLVTIPVFSLFAGFLGSMTFAEVPLGHYWPVNCLQGFARHSSSKSLNLGECLREARSLLKAKLRLREAKLGSEPRSHAIGQPIRYAQPCQGGRGHAVGLYAELHQ